MHRLDVLHVLVQAEHFRKLRVLSDLLDHLGCQADVLLLLAPLLVLSALSRCTENSTG